MTTRVLIIYIHNIGVVYLYILSGAVIELLHSGEYLEQGNFFLYLFMYVTISVKVNLIFYIVWQFTLR